MIKIEAYKKQLDPKMKSKMLLWLSTHIEKNYYEDNKLDYASYQKLMKDLGYNRGYRYSHDYDNNYSYQRYFPEEMTEKNYYMPSHFGFEKEIRKRLDWWESLKKQQLKKETGKTEHDT